jgi:hypothetical protein
MRFSLQAIEKDYFSKRQAVMTQRRYPPTHFYIIAPMSETYASKRECWQRPLEALPDSLRGHISLRNIEAVSALPGQAQETLAQAIQAGLKRLPGAIAILGSSPGISLSELLEQASDSKSRFLERVAVTPANPNALRQLADLVQFCYPNMPRISAEALSDAEALEGVLQVISAQETLFKSSHLNADFVLVLFHACLKQALERLEKKLAENPALQKAISQSNLYSPSLEVSNA